MSAEAVCLSTSQKALLTAAASKQQSLSGVVTNTFFCLLSLGCPSDNLKTFDFPFFSIYNEFVSEGFCHDCLDIYNLSFSDTYWTFIFNFSVVQMV